MKFLECTDLLDLTLSYFSGKDVGDKVITGCIEAYSCKKTGQDKKFSRQLETKLVEEISNSPKVGAVSPLGPLEKASTRKLLINLIATMNATFPDYDFSDTRPRQFEQAPNHKMVMSHVNTLLLNEVENQHPGARESIWKAIDTNIDLENAEIYSFIPDEDSDVFSLGKLWSFNYFFFNKKMKKVLFFQCSATSKLRSPAVTGMDIEDGWNVTELNSIDESPMESAYMMRSPATSPAVQSNSKPAFNMPEITLSQSGWSGNERMTSASDVSTSSIGTS